MKFDNVMNLQAEIFSKVFAFEEVAAAAGVGGNQVIPTYLDPKSLDNDIVAVNTMAVTADAPDIVPMSQLGTKSILATARKAGKRKKRPTDDIALGAGIKAGGDEDNYELVVVYQDRKLKNSKLLKRVIEQSQGEARVIYGGRAKARSAWHRERNNQLRLGSSIGHKKVTAGTLGCFVEDANGLKGVLSNNHVLANVNNAFLGDEIRQPGKSDGGLTADRMASLAGFVPIQFGGASNLVDCAWAHHDAPARQEDRAGRFDSADNRVGRLAGVTPQSVLPGDFVMKTGRTTGYTQGEVDAINFNNLNVNMGGGAIARFDGQIQIRSLSRVPFSRGGDSGSLILDTSSEPVGLLFAGSDLGGFEKTGLTWANPIDVVLDQLSLTIRK